MSSVGQEKWVVLGHWAGEVGDRTPTFRNSLDARQTSKQYVSILVPGCARSCQSIAEGLNRTARAVDSLQLRISKKANGLAIGRPERVRRIVSPGQGCRLQRIQRS